MPREGIPKQYVYLGIFFLIAFIVISMMAGYTVLLILLEIVSSLFVVFFVYGIIVNGIQSKVDVENDDGFEDFHMERGDLRAKISYKFKRLRDKIFYRY